MPTYSFLNTVNNLEFTKSMPMSERETYLKDNPHLVQIFTPIASFEGERKQDTAFSKYVLGRIKEKVPNNNIGQRRWDAVSEI